MCHISAEIVTQIAKEFDIESFAAEEKMMLDNLTTESTTRNPTIANPLLIDSSGPITAAMEAEMQEKTVRRAHISDFVIRNIILNITRLFYTSFNRYVFVQKYKVQKKLKRLNEAKNIEKKKKVDPLFEIEGNKKLNKLTKLHFKKEKKKKVRTGMARERKSYNSIV